MLHHLYGILERPPVASRLPEIGVEDRPVLVRRIGGLAVLSTLLGHIPRATPTSRRRHQEVLEALSVPGPMFPLPFESDVPSHELEPWLGVRAPLVRAGLRTVRGKVEMHVRVLPLHLGSADVTRVREVADRVAGVSGVVSWRGHVSGSAANVAVTLAFLVPRAEVSTFLGRIAPVASRAVDVAVVPSGPWPPFTFVPSLVPAARVPDAVAVPYAV